MYVAPPPRSPLGPAPPTPAGYMWTVTGGSEYCQVTNNGACVTDGIGNHANSEACLVRASQDLYATATEFSTERYYDYIRIGTRRYLSLIHI